MFLFLAGLVAGFIDSIAGGGGLITLPAAALVVGAGVQSIATNKLAGTAAALIALWQYRQFVTPEARKSALRYGVLAGTGAIAGTFLGPHVDPTAFKWILLATCPIFLALTLFKNLWIHDGSAEPSDRHHPTLALVLGFLCGLYDGAWGPGGGTLYFVVLLFVAKVPIIVALFGAKVANSFSAGLSLIRYGFDGHVAWGAGALLMAGAAIGAFAGARLGRTKAAVAVRPMLALVSILLLIRVFWNPA